MGVVVPHSPVRRLAADPKLATQLRHGRLALRILADQQHPLSIRERSFQGVNSPFGKRLFTRAQRVTDVNRTAVTYVSLVKCYSSSRILAGPTHSSASESVFECFRNAHLSFAITGPGSAATLTSSLLRLSTVLHVSRVARPQRPTDVTSCTRRSGRPTSAARHARVVAPRFILCLTSRAPKRYQC
jgi:hypothetical protein